MVSNLPFLVYFLGYLTPPLHLLYSMLVPRSCTYRPCFFDAFFMKRWFCYFKVQFWFQVFRVWEFWIWGFFVCRLCLRGCLMHLIQVDRLYVDDCPRPSVNLSYVLGFRLSSVSSTFPQIVWKMRLRLRLSPVISASSFSGGSFSKMFIKAVLIWRYLLLALFGLLKISLILFAVSLSRFATT